MSYIIILISGIMLLGFSILFIFKTIGKIKFNNAENSKSNNFCFGLKGIRNIFISVFSILIILTVGVMFGYNTAPQKAENSVAIAIPQVQHYRSLVGKFRSFKKTYNITKINWSGYTVELSGAACIGNSATCPFYAKVEVSYFGKVEIKKIILDGEKIHPN